MIDISKAFDTFNRTIASFYQEPGLGFYIPLYQRDYSWDAENITQLMEDICQGVGSFLTDNSEIRFLGTIIRVKENNPRVNINPRDPRAFPTRIDNVIDGQQRISTIALLGALTYQHLVRVGKKLSKTPPFDVVHKEILPSKLETLLELFSVDLRRGTPSRKPIIIRGNVDSWTLDGDDSQNYKSDVSSYLATVIRAVDLQTAFPKIPTGHLVGRNLRLMDQCLTDVESRHRSSSDDGISFPAASEILDNLDLEVQIWNYEREDLRKIIHDTANTSKEKDTLCALVQLLTFSHYLLDRCCFNVIDPISENWAFDMFQSLNATGTALTSLETFKPMVVNKTNSEDGGYKDSKVAIYLARVDAFFGNDLGAAQKAKLTNEYLTALAHTFDGSKLPQRFSSQRTWLNDNYGSCASRTGREEFIREMSDLAIYLDQVVRYNDAVPFLSYLETVPQADRELATFCILYLQDAGHKMAHTILNRFYANVLREEEDAGEEFVEACKATAAFYTLWRSAYSNSGLDNAYRQILKGDAENGSDSISWRGNDITSSHLKQWFQTLLENDKRKIGTKEEWLKKALQYFRFDNAKPVCRFALFLVAQDTIVDKENPGLMKIGTKGSSINYFTPGMWRGKDLKSVEHIAPRTPPDNSQWDEQMYENDDFQRIGNLTLLPIVVNSSASNRSWVAKWIYYQHLAENDPHEIAQLQSIAEKNGIELQDDTIALLRDTTHKQHMKPIVSLGSENKWNMGFVQSRTERICDIMWERLCDWLS